VLLPLGEVPPEAKLNLVIYHLRQHDVGEAYKLIKDLEPSTPQEYILKVAQAQRADTRVNHVLVSHRHS
jgi:hypothetical protein